MDQSVHRDQLEISGQHQAHPAPEDGQPGARPFLMVTFTCAGAYQRVYRAADGTHYMARCPKCAKTMRFVVGSGGTGQRAFNVSC
jgi:hypothetical protein